MVNYKALADDAARNGEIDFELAFARMSAETLTEPQDVATADIKSYLILADKWLGIKRSTSDIAEIVRDALDTFEVFRVTDPAIGATVGEKLTAIMDGLIAEGLIEVTDKAAVLAMTQRVVPKWPGLEEGHVQNAMHWRSEGVI